MYYGQPIAQILSQHWGRNVEFHINPPGNASMGLPDFVFMECGGNTKLELAVGEGKVNVHLYPCSGCVRLVRGSFCFQILLD